MDGGDVTRGDGVFRVDSVDVDINQIAFHLFPIGLACGGDTTLSPYTDIRSVTRNLNNMKDAELVPGSASQFTFQLY
jgi:hypothetical protein